MRRIPILATLIVVAAVAVIVALGFWQLRRLAEKEALLARYAEARASSEVVNWPDGKAAQLALLYHRARLDCAAVTARSSMAGRNARDEHGVAQTAQCKLPDGSTALVVLGWSRAPVAGQPWQGGKVEGVIAPGPRLVASPPLAGLEANAAPDPADIPNNHFAYAVQWFLFAGTAIVIYALALHRRQKNKPCA